MRNIRKPTENIRKIVEDIQNGGKVKMKRNVQLDSNVKIELEEIKRMFNIKSESETVRFLITHYENSSSVPKEALSIISRR